MGSFQKTWNGGKLYKLSGRKGGSVVETRRLGEPRRPWVSLMMSLPSQTETHWMIMLQIGQKTLSMPFSFYTPALQPQNPPTPTIHHPAASLFTFHSPPLHLSPLRYTSILLLSLSIHLSSDCRTFSQLHPFGAMAHIDFGQI